jgi:hypothetical protein
MKDLARQTLKIFATYLTLVALLVAVNAVLA